MPLYALHAVGLRDETVALAYFFRGARGDRAEDAFEALLAAETRPLWRRGAAAAPVAATVAGRVVCVQDAGADLVFLLSGDEEEEDELGLSQALPALLRILALVCEQEQPRLAAAQLAAAHGKAVQCLAEAYPQGVRRSTNAEAVVRAAKMKAIV
jgi:hypothetical protein